jgi:hypothetical protein
MGTSIILTLGLSCALEAEGLATGSRALHGFDARLQTDGVLQLIHGM